MGNQAKCVLRVEGKRYGGKALLETNELIFRGAECRVKIAFGEIRSVTAEDGELRVSTNSDLTVFEVGAVAKKWREKILHPKTRIEKLGVKSGMPVAFLGATEEAFARELRKSKAEVLKGSADGAALLFLPVQERRHLGNLAKAAKKLKGAAGLWVIYPKGKKEITEVDVISAGRATGLKDVKVVGFSATHTALKFVIPVDKR
jgi:hypothetical protein